MGRVFSAEEIAREQIPQEGDHLRAAQFLVDQLFYDQNAFMQTPNYLWFESGIDSGLVHGSVTHGTANVRSDLDTLIIYRNYRDGKTLDTIRRVFGEIATRFNVPVEANLIEITNMLGRNHSIDPLFLKYLQRAEENPKFSYNWPARDLSHWYSEGEFTPLHQLRVVRRYLGAKSASFDKALTMDREFDEHKIQRALELPKNLGRKVLTMFDPDFDIQKSGGDEILKGLDDFIAGRSYNFDNAFGASTSRALRNILNIDLEYDEVLRQAIQGEIPTEEYQDWIDGYKRELLGTASLACLDMQDILDRYERELKSSDWAKEKAEHEEFVANPPIFDSGNFVY